MAVGRVNVSGGSVFFEKVYKEKDSQKFLLADRLLDFPIRHIDSDGLIFKSEDLALTGGAHAHEIVVLDKDDIVLKRIKGNGGDYERVDYLQNIVVSEKGGRILLSLAQSRSPYYNIVEIHDLNGLIVSKRIGGNNYQYGEKYFKFKLLDNLGVSLNTSNKTLDVFDTDNMNLLHSTSFSMSGMVYVGLNDYVYILDNSNPLKIYKYDCNAQESNFISEVSVDIEASVKSICFNTFDNTFWLSTDTKIMKVNDEGIEWEKSSDIQSFYFSKNETIGIDGKATKIYFISKAGDISKEINNYGKGVFYNGIVNSKLINQNGFYIYGSKK